MKTEIDSYIFENGWFKVYKNRFSTKNSIILKENKKNKLKCRVKNNLFFGISFSCRYK